MRVLLDDEAKKLVKQMKGLAKWCHKKRHMDPENLEFMLLVYAEGYRDGVVAVLNKMGAGLK